MAYDDMVSEPRFMRTILLCVLSVSSWQASAADEATALASESESLQLTQKAAPQLNRTESSHYVLLSDAPLDDAQAVTTLLEVTYKAFISNCEILGLVPEPLRHKLVAVLFRDKADYAAFAKANDGMTQTWTAGYYSPRVDRLVMFDAMSNEDVKKAMDQLEANKKSIARQAKAAGANVLDGHGAGGKAAQITRQIENKKDQISSEAEDRFCGTVTHEAAHQLFFHTKVQSRGVMYPLWLAEGLATNFEAADTGDTNLGFLSDNLKRRQAMQEAAQADRLIPLRVLVSKDQHASSGAPQSEDLKNFYGQSCIFTNWLARNRAPEFRLYLEALKNGAYALPSKREEAFVALFGPVESLERVWLRAEARKWKGLAETPWGERLADFENAKPPTPEPDASAPPPPPPPPTQP